MPDNVTFELHPQLAADCVVVGDLPLCRVLLMDNAHFPWVILVPRRAGLREIFELSDDDRQQAMHEMSDVAARMREEGITPGPGAIPDAPLAPVRGDPEKLAGLADEADAATRALQERIAAMEGKIRTGGVAGEAGPFTPEGGRLAALREIGREDRRALVGGFETRLAAAPVERCARSSVGPWPPSPPRWMTSRPRPPMCPTTRSCARSWARSRGSTRAHRSERSAPPRPRSHSHLASFRARTTR